MTLKFLRQGLWASVAIVALAIIAMKPWTAEPAGQAASAFGADFELTDHAGVVRTDEDFAGRWMLVFFGFTHCPDICPTTLAEVAAVMDGLGEETSDVQPLFISIDPERDTPAALSEYVPNFSPAVIGLTGTPSQIERTAKTFHIFYEKIEDASSSGGYTMGHSSQLFLFSPQADFVTSWSYGTPAEQVLSDLKERLRS